MANKIKTTNSIFDLATMDELTLVKEGEFTPVASADEALARVGNDTKRFLQIINEGLLTDATRALREDESVAWSAVDDEGKAVDMSQVIPANQKAVNGLVLNLAKTIYGFNKDMTKEEKRAAKDKSVDFIRANDAIKEGLKKNAAGPVEAE